MLGSRAVVLLRPARTRLPYRTTSLQRVTSSIAYDSLRTHVPRGFVTSSRRQDAGTPSTTVKRAVKREARAATTKKTTKKAATKTAKAKTKKPKTKAKPKKAAKKALTPEQTAARAQAKERLRNRELRVASLAAPRVPRASPFGEFAREKSKGVSGSVVSRIRELTQEFNSLSPAEREHYNHLAQTVKAEREAQYKSWVQSHTVDQIQAANKARKALRRRITTGKLRTAKASRFAAISDERLPKRSPSPYIMFNRARHASGDFNGIAFVDRSKLVAQEWKALSQAEKEQYATLAARG